jgi:hypothetical protein
MRLEPVGNRMRNGGWIKTEAAVDRASVARKSTHARCEWCRQFFAAGRKRDAGGQEPDEGLEAATWLGKRERIRSTMGFNASTGQDAGQSPAGVCLSRLRSSRPAAQISVAVGRVNHSTVR